MVSSFELGLIIITLAIHQIAFALFIRNYLTFLQSIIDTRDPTSDSRDIIQEEQRQQAEELRNRTWNNGT